MAGFDLDDLALFLLQTLPWHRISTPPHTYSLSTSSFPFLSPPLLAVRPMMMHTDTSLLRIPEDLRPVMQVLMRK